MELQRSSPVVRADGASADATASVARDRVQAVPELPPERRLDGATLAALAALAAAFAIALGGWAFAASAADDSTQEGTAASGLVTLLAREDTERIPLRGSVGRIVLVGGADGQAALVLDGLGAAPAGRSYQAWVTRPGAIGPVSAAVFAADEPAVRLAGRVAPGSTVAVTLERAGGAPQPTRTPRLWAIR
jgi:hypothetical protein